MGVDLGLSGKSVLITGASQGIGLACALSFATEGADVVLVSRDPVKLASAADLVRSVASATVTTQVADLSDSSVVRSVAATFHRVDVLINNAGNIPGGSMEDVDEAQWRASWDLKVFGYIEMTRLMLEAMYRRGAGVIVNVIGIGGVKHSYKYVAGASGNAALIAFTQAVGSHSVDRGVRVVGVNPGSIDTPRYRTLAHTAASSDDEASRSWRQSVSADLPFGRPGLPQEVADVVAFLASERASYVSGTTVNVDGGMVHR